MTESISLPIIEKAIEGHAELIKEDNHASHHSC